MAVKIIQVREERKHQPCASMFVRGERERDRGTETERGREGERERGREGWRVRV